MHGAVARYVNCLRLNGRVAALALRNRWLRAGDYAAGYDRVAHAYDHHWLAQIQPVTEALLLQLPCELPPGEILDLGCGTGYTTAELLRRYPDRPVTAVDISGRMLDAARRHLDRQARVRWQEADMLAFLRHCATGQAGLIVSTWAIGYSHHRAVLREAGRVLAGGGSLAFIVNYADTLRPVFHALHRCMARFPQRVERALWPDFPPDWRALERALRASGLTPGFHRDGLHGVSPPPGMPVFDWLLTTGVLAGFDAVLPLLEPGPVADFMRSELDRVQTPLQHHYAMVMAVKPQGGGR